MPSRLTGAEIDRAVAKIRSEYDHFIVHVLKSPDAKRKFDERLADALRARADLTSFLGVEMQVVKALLLKAQHEAEFPAPVVEKGAPKPKPRQSYADRVLAKLRARIASYPDLGLPDADQKSVDVDKLYGTLRWFRREVWSYLYPVILKRTPSPLLFRLDEELVQLTGEGDVFPKEVDAYVSMLLGDAPLSQLSRAQNRCLLQGAQFLHRLRALIDTQGAQGGYSPSERQGLDRALAFCDRVLDDFRLKDLRASL